ncbi:kinase-like domain-containing protein [Roridomyces roridus]|uniref:Kinase-like domain-containing protein n=1 Tax=Roridomyces roridus TaxID=1738132 RepID=A0AAD7FYR4_9AGAR|nr:kinase-like domain-containing protein [Roridomyces roridus]
MAEDNTQICTNPDNPTECCGALYPAKASPGLCSKCTALCRSSSDQERQDILQTRQCQGCSALIKFLVGVYCGLCNMALNKDKNGSSDGTAVGSGSATPRIPLHNIPKENRLETRTDQMRELTAQRLQRKGSVNKPAAHNGAMSHAAIRQIYVFMIPVHPGSSVTGALGSSAQQFDESTPFDEVMATLLLRWKPDWDKDCNESITVEYLKFRFHKNLTFEPNSTLGTIGEFFDVHNSTFNTQREKCFSTPIDVKLKGTYVYIEVRFRLQEASTFVDHFKCAPPPFMLPLADQKKLLKRTLDGEADSGPTKKSRASPLPSKIAPLKSIIRPAGTFTTVSVALATVELNTDEAVIQTLWPNLNDADTVFEKCQIGKELVAQGASQNVYKGFYHGTVLAMKRFSNVGRGRDRVTLDENACETQKEAERLLEVVTYLTEFKALAEERQVDIGDDLSVTDCTLMVEVPGQANDAPCEASGYTSEEAVAAASHMVWLAEPFRPGHVVKWSGTDEHPNHSNSKLGNILNCFAHYIFQNSAESTVLADIQTTKAVIANGQASQVLFDLMTHTSGGASGVGDNGQDGINKFVEQHACSRRCRDLGLTNLHPESDVEDSADESD